MNLIASLQPILAQEGVMKIELVLKEALQSKSHLFIMGQNNYQLSFIKNEDGSIRDVVFHCIGANSLPRIQEDAGQPLGNS